MMTAQDPYAKEVTPKWLRKHQKRRSKESDRQKAVKTKHEIEVAQLKAKLAEIEAKIVKLNKDGAPDSQIKAWRESWSFHNDKLKKLEG